MKKSRYKSLWESHKHDKTFSDAIGVSLHRLQKEKLIIDSTDDEISSQSTRLGVKIFKAIMNVRKSFLMKEKLKELNVKLKGSKEEEEEMSEDDIQNESMRIDHQQVSETLEKHQKSSVTEILESEADVTEMNDDQMSNNSTYSIGHDEEVEEYLTMDGEEPCKDNFDENHSNYNNELNNKNKSTSSAVSLSEQNTQQFTTGGVKRKLMNNDSSLSTTQNKRLCLVEISTSVGINQQPEPRSTSAPKNYKLKEKALDSSLQNEQNDNHQYDENSWKPTTRLQINNITADYETQALYKKISCILNKLTAENMDKLTQQVRDLNINSHEKLKSLVDLVFDRAIDEPYFAAIYSMMCKKLADMQVDVVDMRRKNKTNFHTLLLERCQHEFLGSHQYQRESSWKPTRFQTCRNTDNLETQTLYAKVRFILIQLTPENVDKLTQQFEDLNINTHKRLEGVVDLIFEKAIVKPNFASVYALMCKKLSQMDTNVVNMRQENKTDFRTLLVTRCKQAFESVSVNRRNLITVNQVSKEGSPSRKEYENIEGELEMITTNNEPTEINKQPYAIATSTSTTNQQTSIQLPGSNNTGATTIYISDNKTFDMYSDSPQSPELETTATSQSSTSLLYVIYSQLDEQIKSLINIAIDEFKNKIDHLNYPEFIRRSLEVTKLESLNVREKYWGFVANMITIGIFPLAVFQSEYDKMFEEIKDVSPIFWTYKAEILKILVKRGAHPLKELKRTTLVLKKKGLVGNLVGELLKILVASEGPSAITEKWNNSGIEWTDLLNTSLENPDDIIKRYNLQFLTFGKTDPLNEQLLKLLRKSNIADTFKWIAINVGEETSRTPKFVRKLFTLLLESGIETKYSFDKRNFYQPNRLKIINLLPLMKDYIDGNLESELQCLYGLTNVNHRCKNPPGFVYDIIKELHEKDIISLGAFYVWHNGTAATSELIGHDEAKWNLLSQSFWIKFQESRT
ncbi:hypothetical protein HCN44_000720 [Aphidius gifuensis]|uniref:W2 domain-containing protein n=1 Tax=Aphidius gifuensis TaxID=684658 RepID=A0A834XPD4_APHGI|nr:hypothetical protein HCN44_000720 [Aphidius gifuensis]